MEQAAEKHKPIYACFIDLKAAYGTVPRSRLWKVCQEYSVSKKLSRPFQALYASTKSAFRVDGELTDWLDVNTGLRQGCLLSLALFNVYIDHVLRRTLDQVEKEEKMMWREEWESKRSEMPCALSTGCRMGEG